MSNWKNTLNRSARVFLGVKNDHDRGSFWEDDSNDHEMELDSEISDDQQDLPLWLQDEFWDIDLDTLPVPIEVGVWLLVF